MIIYILLAIGAAIAGLMVPEHRDYFWTISFIGSATAVVLAEIKITALKIDRRNN